MRRGGTGHSDNPVAGIAQALLIYGLTALSVSVYALHALRGAPAMPGRGDAVPLALIAAIPLALLVLFVLRLRSLVIDLRKRRYGSRLRLKLLGLFLLAMAAASVPQGFILLRLAREAQSSAASEDVRNGLSGGLTLVLDYYAEDARRLDYMARKDLPLLAPESLRKEPAKTLRLLRMREPRVDSIEVFEGGRSVAFAGDPQARLAQVPTMGVAGPLASTTQGGVTRLRYLVPQADRGGAVVLSLRLPDNFDAEAAALSRGKAQAEFLAPFSQGWSRLLLLYYLLLVVPLLLAAAMLGFAAADDITEPLENLEAAMKRAAAGDFEARVLAKPGDETGRLIGSFNLMLAGLESYREGDLRQGKLDAWKDIAQRLAHELKNPLTPIRLSAERLLRLSTSDREKALALIEPSMLAVIAEVEAMDALLQDFRSFASLPQPDRDWADLRSLVADSVAPYAASYPDVAFSWEGVGGGITLRADKAQLKRAFANIFANAVEAMGGKGRVEIGADLVKKADSRYCRLRISDDGPGMSQDVLAKIFLPYFTTREKGTGLGLAIVERIIADHGGTIHCESREGSGASFYIDLPFDHPAGLANGQTGAADR
jgi:nitrogen fixation/metabolism regulation signal transduction histidine kinase